MTVPKLERLLDLIAELLHAERPVTADELHRRLPGYPPDKDSFKRAFERDKKDLREMGIPLRIEPVPGRVPPEDGYRIDRDEYGLPDPGLDTDELAALHLATTAVRLDGTSTTTGLRKLGGAVGPPVATGSVPSNIAVLASAPNLSAAFAAVGEHRRVRFRYRDRQRTVDPFRLHHERGHWYLQGHDLDAGESRSFRLDRVEGAMDADEPESVEVRVDPSEHPLRLDGWALGADEPVTARVRVRPPQAALAVRLVGDDVPVEREDDGSVVLQLEVRRRDGFFSFVLGFLDDAVVLGPPELRDELVDRLARMAGERG
jgi:proteasome accessory factor B